MSNKYMKQCSASQATGDMQMKATVRLCLTPQGVAINHQEIKRDGSVKEASYIVGGSVISTATVELGRALPQNTKKGNLNQLSFFPTKYLPERLKDMMLQ